MLAQALGVSVAYLTDASEIRLEEVEFRSNRELGRREQARIQARVLRRLERYLAVEEALASTEHELGQAACGSLSDARRSVGRGTCRGTPPRPLGARNNAGYESGSGP